MKSALNRNILSNTVFFFRFNIAIKQSQNRKQLECNQSLLITSATDQPIRIRSAWSWGIGHPSYQQRSFCAFLRFKNLKSFFLHFLRFRNGPFCASLEPIGNGCAFPSEACCLIRSVLRSGRSKC